MNEYTTARNDHAAKAVPPLPSAHDIAMDVVRRDQRRTRLLAIASLVFWIAAVAGLVLMVTGLNEFLMGVRLGNARRYLQSSTEQNNDPSIAPNKQRDPAAADAGPSQDNGQRPQHASAPYWDDGTSLFHHTLPLIDGSMGLLFLAGASTILLIFSSRRTTLNRINISLAQISEQLKVLGPHTTRTSASTAVANPAQIGKEPA